MKKALSLFGFLSLILFSVFTFAAHELKPVKTDQLSVELITDESLNHSSEKIIGVYFKLNPEWHIYWKNPGDSGTAPKLSLTSAKVIDQYFPYPQRIEVSDLTNYGYENEIVIFFKIADYSSSKTILAQLDWLVCKVECLPGKAQFELLVENGEISNLRTDSKVFTQYWKKLPQKNTKEISIKNSKLTQSHLELSLKFNSPQKNIFIYPEDENLFQNKMPEYEYLDEEEVQLKIPLNTLEEINLKEPQFSYFTLVAQDQKNDIQAFQIKAELKKDNQASSSLLLSLLFAFIGGVLLNLMPCVFPVLALKVYSFVKAPDHKMIQRSAWLYSLGVIFTFFILGLVLGLLQFSGQKLGWGFQLQNPVIVYLLIVLFYVMALSFFDVIEFGNSISLSASNLSQSRFKKILSGDFGTGFLAVLVASPCTAPFMGSALGLTLTLPWYLSLLIFIFLGLGLSLPLVALAHFPHLQKMLPKPGAWLETFKNFMGFPLLLTSLWLLWVLEKQTGSESLFLVLLSILGIYFIFWLKNKFKKSFLNSSLALFILLIFLIIYTSFQISKISSEVQNLANTNTNSPQQNQTAWQNFDPQKLTEIKKTQSVFIDFTASWCITCQVNKKSVLNTEAIQSLFKKHNVYLIRADWTHQDPVISETLAKYNRNSVPLYVFFDFKQNKEIILPELLTPSMIEELFK